MRVSPWGCSCEGEKLGGGTLTRMDEYHHRSIVEPIGEGDVKYTEWMAPTPAELDGRLRPAPSNRPHALARVPRKPTLCDGLCILHFPH